MPARACGTASGTSSRARSTEAPCGCVVDGVQVGSGTPSSGAIDYSLAPGDDGYLGTYPDCGDLLFRGDLDEVSVWNKALPISGHLRPLAGAGDPPLGTAEPGRS